jgi:hypothetical protein
MRYNPVGFHHPDESLMPSGRSVPHKRPALLLTSRPDAGTTGRNRRIIWTYRTTHLDASHRKAEIKGKKSRNSFSQKKKKIRIRMYKKLITQFNSILTLMLKYNKELSN